MRVPTNRSARGGSTNTKMIKMAASEARIETSRETGTTPRSTAS